MDSLIFFLAPVAFLIGYLVGSALGKQWAYEQFIRWLRYDDQANRKPLRPIK